MEEEQILIYKLLKITITDLTASPIIKTFS